MLTSPLRISLDTNPDDCNIHCVMCEVHSSYAPPVLKKRRMTLELLRSVFDELRGTELREVVTTSMGEPLLYEHMDDLIDLCERNQVRLSITTNGTFPRGGAKYWSERLAAIGADIKVSLNGTCRDTQDSIMRGADLDRVLDNIRTLVAIRNKSSAARRSRITLKVTFMSSNVCQLPDLVRLAADLGVDRVRGSHVLSLFPQTDELSLTLNETSRQLFNDMIAEAHRVAAEVQAEQGRAIELSNFVPLGSTRVLGACPFLGREAWIDGDGDFGPCCVAETLRKRLGCFGNVANGGLLRIWNAPEYRQFCTTYVDNPVCQNCEKRRVELEDKLL